MFSFGNKKNCLCIISFIPSNLELCPLYPSYLSDLEGGSKVRLHELMGTLKDTAKLGNLKKQLNVVNKRRKVVAVPLPKHEKQKVGKTNQSCIDKREYFLISHRNHML